LSGPGDCWQRPGGRRPSVEIEPMWIDDIEAEKGRSVAVFATGLECRDALHAFVDEQQDARLHLFLPEGARGLGPTQNKAETLGYAVIDERNWPQNVACLYLAAKIDPALLSSVSKMVWYTDANAPAPAEGDAGDRACLLNVALGLRYGLPLECLDRKGLPIPCPILGQTAGFVDRELATWQETTKALTAKLRTNGMVIHPASHEPALWAVGGSCIDAGHIDMSLGLIWRIRRLELWMDSHRSWSEWEPDEAYAVAAETKECAAALRREIGAAVTVGCRG